MIIVASLVATFSHPLKKTFVVFGAYTSKPGAVSYKGKRSIVPFVSSSKKGGTKAKKQVKHKKKPKAKKVPAAKKTSKKAKLLAQKDRSDLDVDTVDKKSRFSELAADKKKKEKQLKEKKRKLEAERKRKQEEEEERAREEELEKERAAQEKAEKEAAEKAKAEQLKEEKRIEEEKKREAERALAATAEEDDDDDDDDDMPEDDSPDNGQGDDGDVDGDGQGQDDSLDIDFAFQINEEEMLIYQKHIQAEVDRLWRPPLGVPKGTVCVISFTVDLEGDVECTIVERSKVLIYDLSITRVAKNFSFHKSLWGKQFKIAFRQ